MAAEADHPVELEECVSLLVRAESREWALPRSSLVSLRVTPSSPLAHHLSQVTFLDVSHNKLQSLKGIAAFTSLEVLNASYNRIRVGDTGTVLEVTRLTRLSTLDLSHNLIHRMELEEFGLISASRTRLQTEAMRLAVVDLSFNKLVELPDVRLAPCLQVLKLDHNLIEDLLDIEKKIPLNHLQSLHLAGNRIPHVAHLVPVAALAPTLRYLTVSRNPFTRTPANAAGGVAACRWWRPVLLWLAPLLKAVDQVGFSPLECQVTAQLFRERGDLSIRLIELLSVRQKTALEQYVLQQMPPGGLSEEGDSALLMEEETLDADEISAIPDAGLSAPLTPQVAVCSGDVPVPPLALSEPEPEERLAVEQMQAEQPPSFMNTRWVGGGPNATRHAMEDEEEEGERAGYPPERQQARSENSLSPAVTPQRVLPGVGQRGGSAANLPNLPMIVKAMQSKLKSLSSVVETLYKADMSRRVHAAVVLQKHFRGVLVRMHLNADEAEACRFIRSQLQRFRCPQHTEEMIEETCRRLLEDRSSGEPSTRDADLQEVLAHMRSLQKVITTMWKDLELYRLMAARERRRAAVKIQQCYRRFAARKEYLSRLVLHREFIASLTPLVTHLQRCGRAMLARRRLAREVAPRYKIQLLEQQCAALRSEVVQLRKTFSARLDSLEANVARQSAV